MRSGDDTAGGRRPRDLQRKGTGADLAGEEGLHGFGQRVGDNVGALGGGGGSGFLGGGISLNEDGRDAEVARGFNVGQRIADDDAVRSRNIREITESLFEEADLWLTA